MYVCMYGRGWCSKIEVHLGVHAAVHVNEILFLFLFLFWSRREDFIQWTPEINKIIK